MKKALMTISTAIVFAVCCLLGVPAYASETTDISSASVSLSQSSYTYNGSQHKPSVTVKSPFLQLKQRLRAKKHSLSAQITPLRIQTISTTALQPLP